jgi:stearoyl-CoA desaturase (delta-9 desaturase)
METKAWASIHRKHHAKCETIEDPHSPQILGLPKVLFEGAELYKREAKNKETLSRFGYGTPDDWIEHNIYTKYSGKGILLTLLIYIILLGIPGITVWAIQMAWIPFFAAGVINGVGHYFGYRNFECPDAATNIVPWGVLIGGEELHNNHHTYPTSAKLSNKWWEFDIGWLYINIFAFLGLAKIKRTPPKVQILTSKDNIDDETLKSILINRIAFMGEYTKSVIIPIFHQENHVGMHKIKPLLIREDSLIGEIERKDLEQFLEDKQILNEAYFFRKKLSNIWQQTAANQNELLAELQDWCTQAENTGIKYLQEFVAYIKRYSVLLA